MIRRKFNTSTSCITNNHHSSSLLLLLSTSTLVPTVRHQQQQNYAQSLGTIEKGNINTCYQFRRPSTSSSSSSSFSFSALSPSLINQQRFVGVAKSAVIEEKQNRAAAEQLNDCEKHVPEKIATILKDRGLLTLSFPRSAWGYLFHVSRICEIMSGDALEKYDITPDQVVQTKQNLRKEFELLEGTQFGETVRQLRDAAELLLQEEGKSAADADADVIEMALEDVERLATKENLGGESAITDIEEILGQIVDDADELNTVAEKWTLETMGRAGGEEAAIFARELKELYTAYCQETRGWSVEDITEPDTQGGKIRITGRGIYQIMRHEIGVHRVQRVPSTEASGRLQTSTASVFLLPQPSRVSVNINPDDVQIEMVRGSGPGGQGVNSSSNCCRLHHKPSGISLRVHQARSGNANRDLAMDMLAQKLWEKKFRESRRSADDVFSTQWSSGERGERMRTYNFPQNRITDHRYEWNCNMASKFMSGAGPLEELHELAVKVSRERSFKKVLDELTSKLPKFELKE